MNGLTRPRFCERTLFLSSYLITFQVLPFPVPRITCIGIVRIGPSFTELSLLNTLAAG